MSTLTKLEARNLRRAFIDEDISNKAVDVTHAAAWTIYRDSGNSVARDAAYDAGMAAALAGKSTDEVWRAACAAGDYEALDPQKLRERSGERLEFTATVQGFGQHRRGFQGRYVDPLIYLEVHESGERLGCTFLAHGKCWGRADLGDTVKFRASVEGYKLTRPTKVEVIREVRH